MNLYEILGYLASALIAVSLTMSSILRLRILNLAGAFLFAVYGTLIGAVPVAVVNAFIVCINVFYLARVYRTEMLFRILQVRPGSAYLHYFLERNEGEIRRFMPDYRQREVEGDLAFFILRDVVPAGVLMGEPRADGTLDIHVDYVLPDYRDFSIGEFVYERQADFFRSRGIRRLTARALTKKHARYLKRMGFRPDPDAGSGCYAREVAA
jgi:GNAT superfamily N-acetyltransferase